MYVYILKLFQLEKRELKKLAGKWILQFEIESHACNKAAANWIEFMRSTGRGDRPVQIG